MSVSPSGCLLLGSEMSAEGALTLHKVACSRRGSAAPVSVRELEEAEAFQRFRKRHEEFFGGDGLKVSDEGIDCTHYGI